LHILRNAQIEVTFSRVEANSGSRSSARSTGARGTVVYSAGGRELDLAVAVKIFGYRTVRVPTVGEPHDYFLAPMPGTAAVLPRYSAAIAEAWSVVEWARANDIRWLKYQSALQTEVSLSTGQDQIPELQVWRYVRPEHICRAALRVVQE
jgi:hypothetical protein